MTLSLTDRDLLNSLKLYLAARRTALRSALRLRSPLSVEQAEDIRAHYSSYFSNLLAAIDLTREFGNVNDETFTKEIIARFSFADAPDGRNNYNYLRELRNSIVHRGLDVCSAALFPAGFPLFIAPSELTNRSGKETYRTFSHFLLGVIERSEVVVGPLIEKTLNESNLLNALPSEDESRSEFIEAIERNPLMPEWTKKLALDNVAELNFQEVHGASISKLRSLLLPMPAQPADA